MAKGSCSGQEPEREFKQLGESMNKQYWVDFILGSFVTIILAIVLVNFWLECSIIVVGGFVIISLANCLLIKYLGE